MPEVLSKTSQSIEASREDPRVKRILKTMESYQKRPDALIQVLHYVQDVYGHLPLAILELVSEEMGVPPSRVYGVATFYHYFSLKPKGEHTCLVCTGTACYVKGAQRLIDQIEKEFHVRPGETTPDNRLGLQTARCLGACGLAPAVVVDSDIHAKVEPSSVGGILRSRLEAPK